MRVVGMSRHDWLAAAVIAVIAVAIAGLLLRDTGDDPRPTGSTQPPSEQVMSAAAAGALIDELSQEGWRCYDSLDAPVVKRCFLDEPAGDDGSVSVDVALTYADDYLVRASIYAAGVRDYRRHVDVAEQTAIQVGDVLLDGAGAQVAERLGDPREIEIAGRRVYGNRSGASVQVAVESAAYDGRTLPPPDFPAASVLVRNAEAADMSCDIDDATTTCRTPPDSSIGMTITIAEAGGRVRSLAISASNVTTPSDPVVVNMVSGYLYETDLGGGPAASRWVRAQAGTDIPARADLGGLNFRVEGGVDRPLYVTVGEITN
jgi:hypothetical protein